MPISSSIGRGSQWGYCIYKFFFLRSSPIFFPYAEDHHKVFWVRKPPLIGERPLVDLQVEEYLLNCGRSFSILWKVANLLYLCGVSSFEKSPPQVFHWSNTFILYGRSLKIFFYRLKAFSWSRTYTPFGM